VLDGLETQGLLSEGRFTEQFADSRRERGYGPHTHYLLGRRRGGYPLRIGSKAAVESLLAELKSQWREYRRASDPEFRIEGLRAIRRARQANDPERLAALEERYPEAAAYDQSERLLRRLASSVLSSIRGAPKKSTRAVRAAAGRVTSGSRKAMDATRSLAGALLATAQGLLASALSTDLNAMLQSMVAGSATIYDKAMDATYLATHIGGGNHRLFDGGHTVAGAIAAVRDASPDDTVIQEAMGFVQAMFKDVTTPKGLPLANWDPATYDRVSAYLQSNFGIPRNWFYDLNSYTAPELLGGVVGVVATALMWNRADTEQFSTLVGGMGISAAMSANPLLLVVTVVALAKAFHKARQSGEYPEFVDGHLKGGMGAGASLAAASQVALLGGPAGMALLAGLSAGILAHKATEKVSVRQIGQFMAERARAVAASLLDSNGLRSVPGLRRLGFEGFLTVEELRDAQCNPVPAEPGVYLLLRTLATPPEFLVKGTGGRFKNKDPNVTLGRVRREWVEGALIVYVGQSGSRSKGTLARRVEQMIQFGQGAPVAHWGGRLIWQLADSARLVVCWRIVGKRDPRDVERALIKSFKTMHDGKRPFANLRD